MVINLEDERLFTSSYWKIDKALSEHTRFKIIYGGSGSSKSHSTYQRQIIDSLTETRHDTLILRKYSTTLEDSVFNGIKNIIKDWGVSDFFKSTKRPYTIENTTYGTKMLFKGVDDPEKIKSLVNIKRIILEEATEFTFADLKELNRRVRGIEGIEIILIFNPISHTHWIKKHFFDNPVIAAKTSVVKCSYADNQFLTSEDIQELLDLKDIDENDYRVYVLGEWGVITELLAFKPSEWEIIDEIPKDAKRIPTGLDFGWKPDPLACTDFYIKDNYLIWDQLAYHTEMHNIKQHDKDGNVTGYSLQERLEEENFDKNQLIIAECQEPKSIEELRNAGFNVYAVKKRGIIEGVKLLKKYKHLITRRSVGVIHEFENYRKGIDKEGNITNDYVDKDNHHIDDARYVQFMKDRLW